LGVFLTKLLSYLIIENLIPFCEDIIKYMNIFLRTRKG
jgi:hypothetical protein